MSMESMDGLEELAVSATPERKPEDKKEREYAKVETEIFGYKITGRVKESGPTSVGVDQEKGEISFEITPGIILGAIRAGRRIFTRSPEAEAELDTIEGGIQKGIMPKKSGEPRQPWDEKPDPDSGNWEKQPELPEVLQDVVNIIKRRIEEGENDIKR